MRYVFDLDGTLCTLTDGNYEMAKPREARIVKVNELADAGHHITIFTARGMGRYNNVAPLAIAKYIGITKAQLATWEVKYHELILGKPSGDIYIDDKGMKDDDFFAPQKEKNA
jgi:hypothetical protein